MKVWGERIGIRIGKKSCNQRYWRIGRQIQVWKSEVYVSALQLASRLYWPKMGWSSNAALCTITAWTGQAKWLKQQLLIQKKSYLSYSYNPWITSLSLINLKFGRGKTARHQILTGTTVFLRILRNPWNKRPISVGQNKSGEKKIELFILIITKSTYFYPVVDAIFLSSFKLMPYFHLGIFEWSRSSKKPKLNYFFFLS